MYLVLLSAALVFYWAYREWLSWLLLMALVWLPWLSLALSLPAIVTCRLRVSCPAETPMGESAQLSVIGKCALPLPQVKSTLIVKNQLTGQQWKLKNGEKLPADHVGRLHISMAKARCADYLGLFWIPVRHKKDGRLLIRPKPEPVEPAPDLSRYLSTAFQPKSGGGFSENHELRLYRPGDSLRQVHWKLSAKTGKLVYREPMEALRGKAILTLHLSGSPAELDSKLGKLQYISLYLLERDVPHRICCLTGRGMLSLNVNHAADALAAQTAILGCPAAAPDAQVLWPAAAWRYHIGGDGNEA